MLNIETIKNKAHGLNLEHPDVLLLCMAAGNPGPQRLTDILKTALKAGFTKASSWNLSRELAKRSDKVIRTTSGWELTKAGLDAAYKILGLDQTPQVLSAAVESLHKHIASVKNADARLFLTEAVRCVEAGLFRAAVVLTWVGAVAVLQDEVVSSRLAEFNLEATRRDSKWKSARNADGLSRMTEHDFLNILDHISVIGKNVKQELEGCLKLRNGCGHPNSLKIGENKVAAHIETLIQNVFVPFLK